MGLDAMIFIFWMLSFQSAFKLFSFTFIKRLFSTSSLFCHKGGVICISEVIDISYHNLDSSLSFIQPSISHKLYKLNKQGDNANGRKLNNLNKQGDNANCRKGRGTNELLDEGERVEWKSWLKTQHSKSEDHGIQSHHFMANIWGKNGNSGLQNHCRQWL